MRGPMSASRLTACAVLVMFAFTTAPVTGQDSPVVEISLSGSPYKSCPVAISPGATGGEALDAAVASGCLLEWSHDSFEGYGRYVTSVDFVSSAVATYWALYVDGQYSDLGIDALRLQPGQVLTLDYQQWIVQ